MSGLNPDGLGRTAAFSNSESDSLSTEQATTTERQQNPAGTADNTLIENGTWYWSNKPTARRYAGSADKTYFSAVSDEGEVKAAAKNHETGAVTTTVLDSDISADDHSNGTVHVLSDGRVAFFWNDHGRDAELRYAISSSPEDVSSFDSIQRVDVGTASGISYTCPYEANGELHVFLRYRGSDTSPIDGIGYVKSPDITQGASSFSDLQKLFSNSEGWNLYAAPYSAEGSDRVDFIINRRDNLASGPTTEYNIYHCYLDTSTETLYEADGTLIGSSQPYAIPADGAIPLIYDSEANNENAWGYDVTVTNGRVELVWDVYPESDRSDHNYYHAKFDGSWSVRELIDAGHNPLYEDGEWGYAHGVTLDPEQEGVVYAATGSRKASKVVRLETTDGGTTWVKNDVCDPNKQNMRPVVPINRRDDFAVLWDSGEKHFYQNGEYDMDIKGGISQTNAPSIPQSATAERRFPFGNFTVSSSTFSVGDGWGTVSNISWLKGNGGGGFEVINPSGYGRAEQGNAWQPVNAGPHYITSKLAFQSFSADATLEAVIYELESGEVLDIDREYVSSGEQPIIRLSGVFSLSPNDTIAVRVRHDSGNNETVIENGGEGSHFCVMTSQM